MGRNQVDPSQNVYTKGLLISKYILALKMKLNIK